MPGSKHKGSGMGGRLFWAAAIALALSVISVNISKHFLSKASAGVSAVVQPTIFVGAFTAVTTKLGMRALLEKVHRLRERFAGKN